MTGESGPQERRSGAELTALHAALAAEHAAVYGYGVVGGKVGDGGDPQVRAAYDAHRARRDELARAVRDLGGTRGPPRRRTRCRSRSRTGRGRGGSRRIWRTGSPGCTRIWCGRPRGRGGGRRRARCVRRRSGRRAGGAAA